MKSVDYENYSLVPTEGYRPVYPDEVRDIEIFGLRYIAQRIFPEIPDYANFWCAGMLQINNLDGVEMPGEGLTLRALFLCDGCVMAALQRDPDKDDELFFVVPKF